MEQIQYIYNELKNDNETAIIENYGYKAKRYNIVFTCKTITMIFIHCKINSNISQQNYMIN